MRCPQIRFTSLLSILAVVGFASPATSGEVQVGDEVVVVRQDGKIKIKAKVIALPPRGQVCTIKQIRDDWYWVDYSQGLGWISSQDAAPVETALEIFSEAIAKSPTAYKYKLRGWLRSHAGQHEKAIADFGEAIRIDPKDFEAYGSRAEARRRQGDLVGAIEDCDTVIQMLADNPFARDIGYILRAQICAAGGKYEQALADCEELIQMNSRRAGAYALPAWIFATCPDAQFRDGKKAVEYGTKAVNLSRHENPDRPAILAAAYAEVGDFVRAVECQKKAISIAVEKDRPEFTPALKLYESGRQIRDHTIGGNDRPRLYFESFIQ